MNTFGNAAQKAFSWLNTTVLLWMRAPGGDLKNQEFFFLLNQHGCDYDAMPRKTGLSNVTLVVI